MNPEGRTVGDLPCAGRACSQSGSRTKGLKNNETCLSVHRLFVPEVEVGPVGPVGLPSCLPLTL